MKQRWLNCKKRCAVQNGAGTLAWTYDPFGHITQRTTTVGAHTLVTATTFDAAGRLATLTTPAGHTLTYTWDKDQLTAVSLDGTLLLTDITRAPFGPLDAWRWADGTDTVRLFNRNGEPIAQAVQAPNDTPRTTVLTRDAAGRITKIEETDATTQTYTYDLADRLREAEGHWNTLAYTFDATGNRLTQTGTAPDTAYTYPATSHRLQAKTGPEPRTYTYDPSGRLTNDGALTYSYDGAGRLKEVRQGANVMHYGYSADGRRLYKDNGTEQRLFVHDEQGHLLGEYRATTTAWTAVAEYVWLDDLPVATIKPDLSNPSATKVYRIEPDHLGTPRRVTDDQNRTVWRWSSTPFGESTPNEDPDNDGTPFTLNLRFAGQYFDKESGLHYNFNRFYDRETGRYISSDPIGLEGGINTYTYVVNNPLSLIDPEGLAGNGGDGSASGRGTNTPYKHCREYNPPDPRFIECKEKSTGRKKRVPRPDSWPFPEDNKSEMCGGTCQKAIMYLGGTAIIVAACITAPAWAPAAASALGISALAIE